MGVDMDEFRGQQGNTHDSEAETTTDSPGIIKVGSGMTGHELGALEGSLGDVGELHDGTQRSRRQDQAGSDTEREGVYVCERERGASLIKSSSNATRMQKRVAQPWWLA